VSRDHIVALAHQFRLGEAAHPDEALVGEGDDAAGIGPGNEDILGAEPDFVTGDRKVELHGCPCGCAEYNHYLL
jgi:hypothetical protein